MKIENFEKAELHNKNFEYYQNKINLIKKLLESDNPLKADIYSESSSEAYDSHCHSLISNMLENDLKFNTEKRDECIKMFEGLE